MQEAHSRPLDDTIISKMKLSEVEERSCRFRGRIFSSSDLRTIARCVADHYDEGRTKISRAICEELAWKQGNGWLKDRACRDVLRILESDGIISLPPARSTGARTPKKKESNIQITNAFDLASPLLCMPDHLELEFAKANKSEKIWNAVVAQYHYLGHQVTVGKYIKYLIKAEDRIVAAIAFSSPAWRLASRDSLLTRLGFSAEEIHDVVINNSRFLILPHVHVTNLATRVLALTTKQVIKDWTDYYAIEPHFVETFVQPSLYHGTCYKAANWHHIGITQGYAKRGQSYRNSQEPKQIYIYALNKKSRAKLAKLLAGKNSDIDRASFDECT